MPQPTRLKYHKWRKGHNTGTTTRDNKVSFGKFGLKAVGRGRLTACQIEAACCIMTHHIKHGDCIRIRMFPGRPITKKPIQVRVSGGKGSMEYYIAEVRPGKISYEMDDVPESLAREASELAAAKLPIPTTSVVRRVGQ